MTLWAVTMVRDEMDVLPHTLSHLVGEGVDGLIVADNRSVDGTREWLHEFARTSLIPVEVIHDDEVGYYQSVKMSAYYGMASDNGADWVIPFDADEIWHTSSGVRLRDLFDSSWQLDVLEAEIYNYFPTSNDGDQVNPLHRIVHRAAQPAPLVKVAVRGGIESLVIEQGNHGAHAERDLSRGRPGLIVGHFPWRSPEQFESKVRNGGEAYAATSLAAVEGQHWRQHARILTVGGSAALRAVYDEWYMDPPVDLVQAPVPWRG